MTTSLPSNYIPSLPRVSEICEWVYPFKGTEDERRFHMWLEQKGVSLLDYMKEASSGGTYVHKKLEEYCLNGKVGRIKKEYKDIVMNGILAIKSNEIKPLENEVYTKTKLVQGTIDMIGEWNGKKYIFDFKSWSLAKYKFGLDGTPYRKPYSKLKKARLQLSIYAHSRNIKNIAIIEVNKEGFHLHELEIMSKKEVNSLIKEFYLNYLDEL